MNVQAAREQALEIAERIDNLGPVGVVRFFSGAGLVAQGIMFGFVIRGSLYLRVDDTSRAAFEAADAAPFSYTVRSKIVTLAAYYEAPVDIFEDSDELARWAAEALRAAAAVPRRAAKRKSSAKHAG
jgi:DNA transformation protein and related proteins